MTSAPSIRKLSPDEWRTYRNLRLQALAESPHAFGATLADEQARGDQFWIDRLGATPSVDLPLVAEVDSVPIGLAWGRIEATDTAHVYQMWVAPAHRRAGVGRHLLDAIVHWARSRVRYLVLGVTTGNAAALHLYSRAGFIPVGEPGKIWGESAAVAQQMRLELETRPESPPPNKALEQTKAGRAD